MGGSLNIRGGGLVTILAASIGVALTPMLWLEWHQEWLVPCLQARVSVVGNLAELIAGVYSYSSYGRFYCFVFLGVAAGFAALMKLRFSVGRNSNASDCSRPYLDSFYAFSGASQTMGCGGHSYFEIRTSFPIPRWESVMRSHFSWF